MASECVAKQGRRRAERRRPVFRLGSGQKENTRFNIMNIRILDSARKDLTDGFWFYEKQEVDLGSYFLDALFSDVDSLNS
ncbi:MAG: hypothetical protein QME74_03540, partial [Candidatus Edwardsbacteria bacterium]|nr:hypothetical protein [Candidatus Edwardsbacteria bacterium]